MTAAVGGKNDTVDKEARFVWNVSFKDNTTGEDVRNSDDSLWRTLVGDETISSEAVVMIFNA